MVNFGRYHYNLSDAFWGNNRRICRDKAGQIAHAKVRRCVMLRCIKLDRYLERTEGPKDEHA